MTGPRPASSARQRRFAGRGGQAVACSPGRGHSRSQTHNLGALTAQLQPLSSSQRAARRSPMPIMQGWVYQGRAGCMLLLLCWGSAGPACCAWSRGAGAPASCSMRRGFTRTGSACGPAAAQQGSSVRGCRCWCKRHMRDHASRDVARRTCSRACANDCRRQEFRWAPKPSRALLAANMQVAAP